MNKKYGEHILAEINKLLPPDKPADMKYMGPVIQDKKVIAYKYMFYWGALYKAVMIGRQMINNCIGDYAKMFGANIARMLIEKEAREVRNEQNIIRDNASIDQTLCK
jgi:hypothetical protein